MKVLYFAHRLNELDQTLYTVGDRSQTTFQLSTFSVEVVFSLQSEKVTLNSTIGLEFAQRCVSRNKIIAR